MRLTDLPVLPLLIAALIAAAAPAASQEAIYVIRHGEMETGIEDPPLTSTGRARAEAWAAMLAPARLDAVLASDARRAQETGEIVASVLDIPFETYPIGDVVGLIDLLGFDHEDSRVLIVAHTETIPSLLSGLGVTQTVEHSKADHAPLYVIAPHGGDAPTFLQLRMPD